MKSVREEQTVRDQLIAILGSIDADNAYDRIPDSRGGKLLNADIARELCPHYRTVQERIAYTRVIYPPCSDYVFQRFMRAVGRKPRVDPLALFLAGGAASGKTTAAGSRLLGIADLVFDSNLANADKAKKMIDAAVAHRWDVQVFYVHRNFQLALVSMLLRAIRDGRYIPVSPRDGQDLASLHFNSQRTIVHLARHYADNEAVAVSAFRNPWDDLNPTPVEPVPIPIETLAPGGKRHYSSVKELYEIEDKIVRSFQAEGRISKELAVAIGIAQA